MRRGRSRVEARSHARPKPTRPLFRPALVLAVTPGPGIFYVAARTLAGGRPEGVASSVGTGLGGMIHVLVGSLGVSPPSCWRARNSSRH